ncbi:MAG: acyl carrier protein [Gammaproteobacteria bacterium]|nr:acyl carrier protein [Gammaproteobacteria bacterium]
MSNEKSLSMENPALKIIEFIKQEILDNDVDIDIGEKDNLLQLNLIDSLGVMRMVDFVKREFDVIIPPEDITIEHFRTADLLCRYVLAKRA